MFSISYRKYLPLFLYHVCNDSCGVRRYCLSMNLKRMIEIEVQI